MSVAEAWVAPDWFSSRVEPDAGVRIVIVDGTSADERHLLEAAQRAGIDCPWGHGSEGPRGSTALLFEARDLELACRQLRALRADSHFEAMPAILAVRLDQLACLELGAGFDDFVLHPCTPLEVRARVRGIERRRQEAAPRLELEPDGISIDAVAHEAMVEGRTVRLTSREFALFAYLRTRRGHVLSRQHLLARVWGHRYQGGARTVDTHIGRLRLKFGAALPIETVRANGYRLGSPQLAVAAE